MEIRIACAIRNSGAGWHIISDGNHQPIGVSHLTEHADHVKLHYEQPALKVHTFVIGPDETYGAIDVAYAGASVGLSYAGIMFSRPATGMLAPSALSNALGNFFIYGLLSD